MEKFIHEALSMTKEKCQCLFLHCKYKIEFGSIKHNSNIWVFFFKKTFFCLIVCVIFETKVGISRRSSDRLMYNS